MDMIPDKREHSLNLIVLQDLIREQKAEIERRHSWLRAIVAVSERHDSVSMNIITDAVRGALEGGDNGQ